MFKMKAPPADDYARSFVTGIMDCLLAYGTIIADSTGRSREEIAEVMERVIEQQRKAPGGFDPVRATPAHMLQQFFGGAVKRDWQP
jgi:hypothetical protein